MNAEAVLERFNDNTKMRLKPATQKQYTARFRIFFHSVGLDGYTRRQLAGTKGKALILDYLARHPRQSWQTILAMLKAVWSYGLNLPWPLEMKRDIGKLPRTRRGENPSDEAIKAWAEALSREKDIYVRLLWLMIAQHGWRPSHVGRMKWRNVRYDAQGKPTAIVADGAKEDFKTQAPVAARLAPDVTEALAAWKKAVPDTYPEKPILPWRSVKGELDQNRQLDQRQISKIWRQLRAKWGLPGLRPKDCRHWVATACRKAGLSKQASALQMGHDSAAGGAMRDWYDSPQLADILDEQAAKLPRGALGLLRPPELEVVQGIPPEAMGLLRDFLDGRCGAIELASKMEAIRLRQGAPMPPIGL